MVSAPRIAAALLLAATVTACGAKTADYTTLLPSSPTSTATSTSAATPTPIAQYLSGVGVTGAQVPLDKLNDLTVTLPRPPGWTKYANPNFSPGTEAIAKNNTYPTAMVMVFKLSGNFDLPAAMKHANDDALLAQSFTKLNSSEEDFNGFPSSMIEGSYDHLGTRLHTYNRVVVPVTATFDRYLVQFTVTTLADQAAASAPDVEKVIAGFSVSVK